MLKLKHTPGPWKRERRSVTEAVLTVDGEIICEVYGHSTGDAQKAIANARLIAIAPKMFSICKDILSLKKAGYRVNIGLYNAAVDIRTELEGK